ncbi:uroporphyrinogen decarboxylase family protein [bacterium]|nr:uroporphyrinogen decarboxylase family protein [bacterium]
MTSRERLLAATRRQPVDYVPCCMPFNPLSAAQRRGRSWNFPWAPETTTVEQLAYQVGELGLDQVVHLGCTVSQAAPGVESEVRLDGDVLHKTFHTPAGDLHAAVRINEMWPHGQDIPFHSDFNIGHFVEPWLQTEGDLAALMQVRQPLPAEEARASAIRAVEGARALAGQWDLATVASVGTGLTGALQLFGATELCLMVVEQPELVEAYVEHEHQLNLLALRSLAGLGVDMVRRNGFYETADFYGPAMLERFLGDRLRAERDAAHAGGMLMTYTVHTGVMPILDYLAGLGLDAHCGIDLAFDGVVPAQVRSKLAPTSSLWTGPSSTYHLWNGPEPTREAVRLTFDVMGKTGLVLSPCVSAHSIMPWESTLAMVDEWKRLR